MTMVTCTVTKHGGSDSVARGRSDQPMRAHHILLTSKQSKKGRSGTAFPGSLMIYISISNYYMD